MINFTMLAIFYLYLLIGFLCFLIVYNIINEITGYKATTTIPMPVIFVAVLILWLPILIVLLIKSCISIEININKE